MATAKKDIGPVDNEKVKREKEWKAREKAERQTLEKKKAEKKKKEAAKRKRISIKEKREMKKINEKINFPYKVLFNFTMLITIISFMTIFYGWNTTLFNAIFYSFFIFLGLYIGIGALMVGYFYVVSEEKKKETEIQKQITDERRKEEERKLAEEHAQLEEHLREEYLKQGTSQSQKFPELDFDLDTGMNQLSPKETSSPNEAPLEDSILDSDLSENPFLSEEEDYDDTALVDQDFINDILTPEEQDALSDNEHIRTSSKVKGKDDGFEPFIDS